MTGPHQQPRFEIMMSDVMWSRGTNEAVPLGETTPLDFMPQLLGAQFLTVPYLRDRVHLTGDHYGPYLALENGYKRLAEDELRGGSLHDALDAYRRSLYYATRWLAGVSSLQGALVLSEAMVEKTNIGSQFEGLEARLGAAVWAESVTFDPDAYAAFVRDVRETEKSHTELYQLFNFGNFGELTVPTVHDPDIGRRYIDVCVRTNRWHAAVRAAGLLQWPEKVAELQAGAMTGPQEHPRTADIQAGAAAAMDY